MMRAAEARGAELRLGNVTGLLRHGGEVVGVDLDGEALEGDAVVIAMGPWCLGHSQRARDGRSDGRADPGRSDPGR
jgi:glycine/D-amino acid oxidase-like deaminating enzyme